MDVKFKKIIKLKRLWVAVIVIIWLAFFEASKSNAMLAGFIENNIAEPYRRFIGVVFGIVPFSVTELLYVLAVVIVIIFVVNMVRSIIKGKGKRVFIAIDHLFTATVAVLFVSGLMLLLWGVGYYAHSPVQRLQVQAEPVSVEQLTAVTQLFADKLYSTAEHVQRDENGVYSEDKVELIEQGRNVYDNLEEIYPHLEGTDITVKPMTFSFFMSEINYTGFFFALTGEPNINIDQPAAFIPSTIAHELAHARGIMPEQDCNFVAILACEYSDNIAYQYSGQLLAYVNLSNALYSADYDAWEQISKGLHPYVVADIRNNNEYWQQYKGAASEIADTIYEGYLQGHDQTDGLKSYGKVTDLLIDWYYDETLS